MRRKHTTFFGPTNLKVSSPTKLRLPESKYQLSNIYIYIHTTSLDFFTSLHFSFPVSFLSPNTLWFWNGGLLKEMVCSVCVVGFSVHSSKSTTSPMLLHFWWFFGWQWKQQRSCFFCESQLLSLRHRFWRSHWPFLKWKDHRWWDWYASIFRIYLLYITLSNQRFC